MKIDLVGKTYVQSSLPFNAERSINLYANLDEDGAEVASMYGTPGLLSFATCGAGPHRGSFRSASGRAFLVADSNLYESDSAGNVTIRGSLDTSNGRVTITESITQLGICDGEKLYYLTYATNAYAKVTDPDLPASVGYLTNIDGYFVVTENDTGRFYISAINDISSWGALDFATAESNPDILNACVNAVGQLWLLGETTTEIWTNSGGASFPFSRVGNVVMQAGVAAKHTALEIDNSLIFVGRDKFGAGIVYRANGFTPQRISTTPIERIIQEHAASFNDMYALAYQKDGHLFYIISGGTLPTSLVYDLTTQLWHERAWLNTDGVFEQHLGASCIYAFDKLLVGDRRNGKVYEMSDAYYDDDGDELVSERVYTHLIDERKRIRYNSLEINFETGVGTQTGQGANPKVSLQVSKDGARTWSDWFDADIGSVGKYQTTVKFRRLGIAEIMTFKLRVSDPIKRAITGSYIT